MSFLFISKTIFAGTWTGEETFLIVKTTYSILLYHFFGCIFFTLPQGYKKDAAIDMEQELIYSRCPREQQALRESRKKLIPPQSGYSPLTHLPLLFPPIQGGFFPLAHLPCDFVRAPTHTQLYICHSFPPDEEGVSGYASMSNGHGAMGAGALRNREGEAGRDRASGVMRAGMSSSAVFFVGGEYIYRWCVLAPHTFVYGNTLATTKTLLPPHFLVVAPHSSTTLLFFAPIFLLWPPNASWCNVLASYWCVILSSWCNFVISV